LRLATAAKIAFPNGTMTASGLRNEARKGNLEIELIAGRHFTTLANIEKMREKCRVEAKDPVSISEKERDAPPIGSSSTGIAISPQDAARLKANELKKHCKHTSTQNIE
jgi:hypothetical protein